MFNFVMIKMRIMKNLAGLLFLILFTTSCGDNDPAASEFTGISTVYNLTNVSAQYSGGGTVTFRERVDGAVTIEVEMQSTGTAGSHPLHIHHGTFDIADAEMAALLTPVDAASGLSTSTISSLIDGTSVDYNALSNFDGSIKIHLDDGPNKTVVLAAVNIGINAGINSQDIAVCSSAKESI